MTKWYYRVCFDEKKIYKAVCEEIINHKGFRVLNSTIYIYFLHNGKLEVHKDIIYKISAFDEDYDSLDACIKDMQKEVAMSARDIKNTMTLCVLSQ